MLAVTSLNIVTYIIYKNKVHGICNDVAYYIRGDAYVKNTNSLTLYCCNFSINKIHQVCFKYSIYYIIIWVALHIMFYYNFAFKCTILILVLKYISVYMLYNKCWYVHITYYITRNTCNIVFDYHRWFCTGCTVMHNIAGV